MKQLLKAIVCLTVLATPVLAGAQSLKEQAEQAFLQGNYEKAAERYSAAAIIASNETEHAALTRLAQKSTDANRLLTDANSLWERGKYSDAVAKYNELLNLNPNDSLARKRIEEKDCKAQLDKAMYWYSKHEWSQALVCFGKAGSTTDWTQAQLNAYRRCREESAYASWNRVKGSYNASGESDALYIVQNFPESRNIREVKNWLFEYYMRGNEYGKAAQYATTQAQNSRLASAREEYNKNKEKQERKEKMRKATAIPFYPVWSVAAELDIIGTEPFEAAMPIEVRLLDVDSRLNIHLGAHIGVRGMLSGDSTTYLDGSARKEIKGSFSYYQLSPCIKARLNLSESISRVGGFFLSGLMRLNYNFSYTYTEELSDVNQSGRSVNTNTNMYHPKETLTPLTFTVGGELGYGSEMFELYFYYTYDLTRPVGEKAVAEMGFNAANPHYSLISRNTFGDRFAKTGFFGAGLRLYLSE
ncbi:MAG: hypothetical protein IKM79_07735 [Bacteroidales bacterium]|nr:hypothetical protein [Bacteroidales bacterium]